MGRRGFPSNRISCFNCGGPHLRRYCPQIKQGITKPGAAQHRRGRSDTKKVTVQKQDSEAHTVNEEMESDQSNENQLCGACLIYTNTVTYSRATAETALTKTETLKTPENIGQGITPAQVCSAQKEDPGLQKIKTV